MTISAKMIADSTANGIRISSIECRYPRFIHAELMTHRVFSRNASSSRAIPVEKLIDDVIDDPAMPVKWFKNKPGMQGTEEIVGAELEAVIQNWLWARDEAVFRAQGMVRLGLHKQHANRLLEPFGHITVLITSTQWSNFLALRDHPDADPTIQVLAKAIKVALDGSAPRELRHGQWHLPYVTDFERSIPDYSEDPVSFHRKISVARCARTSYKLHDGSEPSISKDLALYEKLVGSVPLHASPAEHQATPDTAQNSDLTPESREKWCRPLEWNNPHLHGNFTGWIQFRKTLPGECQ